MSFHMWTCTHPSQDSSDYRGLEQSWLTHLSTAFQYCLRKPKIHSLPLFGTETSDVRGIQSIFFKHIFLKILFSSLLIVPRHQHSSTLIAPSCLLERVPRADLHLRARIFFYFFFSPCQSAIQRTKDPQEKIRRKKKKKKNRPQSELTIR